jgi:hypothetical protein
MLAVLVAALLTAAPNTDTVVTADGTRIQGTVVEESPSKGVTIQVDDGTLRRFERGQVTRIEFGDGSVSNWTSAAPAPAPAAPPSVAQAPPPAQPQVREERSPLASGPIDTVFFLGGGRVRGTVLEESPTTGVTIRLLDGNVRRYSRSEIVRIEYADGSVSRRRQAPPPRPAPMGPSQAAPLPPSEPPVYQPRRSGAPLVPVYGAIGLGGTFFGGESFDGVRMSDDFKPQAHIGLEGGLRLSPAFALGVYMDVGAGDVAREVRDFCDEIGGADCAGTSGRFGFLVRHTWNHSAPTSQWLSLGTGWEFGAVTTDDDSDADLYSYSGREYVRLGGGLDFRSNAVLGVGFYGSVSWGEYDDIDYNLSRVIPPPTRPDEAMHTTVQVGLRLTLFP